MGTQVDDQETRRGCTFSASGHVEAIVHLQLIRASNVEMGKETILLKNVIRQHRALAKPFGGDLLLAVAAQQAKRLVPEGVAPDRRNGEEVHQRQRWCRPNRGWSRRERGLPNTRRRPRSRCARMIVASTGL